MWLSSAMEIYALGFVLSDDERIKLRWSFNLWQSKQKIKYLKGISCPFAQRDLKELEAEVKTLESAKNLLTRV